MSRPLARHPAPHARDGHRTGAAAERDLFGYYSAVSGMSWSFWAILGMGLLVFEVVTPGGFFTVFFGVAALVVALLVSLGLLGSGAAQWLVFAVLGTVLILALRPMVRRRFETDTPKVDQIVAQIAIALENFDENGRGKVELRGTSWSAVYSGPATVVKGDRLRVVKVDGLSLLVDKE